MQIDLHAHFTAATAPSRPGVPTVDYRAWGALNALAVHPHDPGVFLGGVGRLHDLPDGVDAVVSLCRLGATEVPSHRIAAGDHVEVWPVDRADSASNPHLDLVLAQAADTVAALRTEGRTVLLHCLQAASRTPTVAALYATRHRGIPAPQALDDIRRALPAASPNPAFLTALARLAPEHR